jgi:hypothetical protein
MTPQRTAAPWHSLVLSGAPAASTASPLADASATPA